MEKIPCDENNYSYLVLEYLNCHISGNTFELKSTTSSMVCSLLDKLCKSKATGLDKISAKLLRYCPDLLSESLTVIFNCSINTGIFPVNGNAQKSFHYLNTVSRGAGISIIGGGGQIFIYSCSAQLISFEIDCF